MSRSIGSTAFVASCCVALMASAQSLIGQDRLIVKANGDVAQAAGPSDGGRTSVEESGLPSNGTSDLEHSSADTIFTALDANHDGRLTAAEAFDVGRDPAMRGAPILKLNKRAMERLGWPIDGDIDRQKFAESHELKGVVIGERWLRRSAAPKFKQLDADGDGRVEIESLVAASAGDELTVRRDARVVDFDRNGSLTFEEFVCLPSIGRAKYRGPVPDPIVEKAEREISKALDLLRSRNPQNPGSIPIDEWKMAVADMWHGRFFKDFDLDQDRAITAQEVSTALEVSFGIRSLSGELLRYETGRLFIWNTIFHSWDRNQDRLLSREEFVPKFWKGPEAAEAVFARLDTNGDGRLVLSELHAGDELWTDILDRFRGMDKDLNGFLSHEELMQGSAGWEQPYVAQLQYSAGSTANVSLSFSDFRETPWGNPVLDWRGRRKDSSGDGRLDLMEFHPRAGWPFLGVSKVVFDRFDRDQSGFLEPGEFEFEIDLVRAPPALVFQSLDGDHDGRLALSEMFADGSAADLIGSAWRERLLACADINGDRAVDLIEFTNSREMRQGVAAGRWRRGSAKSAFERKDRDQSGSLSPVEWLADTDPEKRAGGEYDYGLCDFDGNGAMSFEEFCCTPGIAPLDWRGPFPDPVLEEVQRLEAQILQSLTQKPPELTELATTIPAIALGVSRADVLAWDQNHDGALSTGEILRGMDVAYGVRHPDGSLLRRSNGQVFDWRTFRSYDSDHSGSLTTAEFAGRHWGGPEKADAAFREADHNGDGRLTVLELSQGQLLWIDTLQAFKRFDKDRNGRISAGEIHSQAASWEEQYGQMAFPGFDSDGDATLSFVEFRSTFFANPLADWNTARTDTSHDGFLSLEEFHPLQSPELRGLSSLFFSRLDRDRDDQLAVEELTFRVDLRKVPEDVVFRVLDTDRDRQLTVSEAVAYGRPKAADGPATLRYEEKVARIEKSFQAADRDHNGSLTSAEFGRVDTSLAGVITGRVSRVPSPRRSMAGSQQPAGLSWRMVGLIGCNILLLAGLAWGMLRSGRT